MHPTEDRTPTLSTRQAAAIAAFAVFAISVTVAACALVADGYLWAGALVVAVASFASAVLLGAE